MTEENQNQKNLEQKNLEEMMPSAPEERHRDFLNEHYNSGMIFAKEHDIKGLEIAAEVLTNHYWNHLDEIKSLNQDFEEEYIQKLGKLYYENVKIERYLKSLEV